MDGSYKLLEGAQFKKPVAEGTSSSGTTKCMDT